MLSDTLLITASLLMVHPVAERGPEFESPGVRVFRDHDNHGREFRYLLIHDCYCAAQYLPPAAEAQKDGGKARLPMTYLHPHGPVGVALHPWNWFASPINNYAADARLPASLVAGLDPLTTIVSIWTEPPILVVKLDAGAIAGYARPLQQVDFLETNAAVIRLSEPGKGQQRYFTYVADARKRGAAVDIHEGEPRPWIEKEAGDGFYQLMIVGLSRDRLENVRSELLTKEGMRLLLSKLGEHGVICYETSNRYYNLAPVIAGAADALKCSHFCVDDLQGRRPEVGHFSSTWVFVAHDERDLQRLKTFAQQHDIEMRKASTPHILWRDGAPHSFRGLYQSDPLVSRLRHETLNLLYPILDRSGFRFVDSAFRVIDRAVVAWHNCPSAGKRD